MENDSKKAEKLMSELSAIHERIAELEKTNFERTEIERVLRDDITKRMDLEKQWKKSEFIINSAKELMTLINRDYVYEAVNDSYCRAHERTREEIIGRTMADVWGEEKFKNIIKVYFDQCLEGKEVHYEDWFVFPHSGRGYYDVAYYPFRLEGDVVTHVVVTTHDITARKLAEDALKKSEEELKANAHRLEEMNDALKLLAKRREDDKKESETKVLANVRELVVPYITRLKNTEMDKTQTTYVDIIESNLNEIVSPLLRTLSSQMLNFTPKEIQVAALIRDGKPTKEIAKLMRVSKGAIDIHRNHIRTKLGLNKKKANLRSYLLSLK
jgi:PAS domain S-box-containing protein